MSYDANGNMLTRANSATGVTMNLTWDEENRLNATQDKFGKTTYTYDESGLRATKTGVYGKTTYATPNYTISNNETYSTHVFAGNTRVATRVVAVRDGKQIDDGVYYYAGDHLGSSSVVTDRSGNFYEQTNYFPYGDVWVTERDGKVELPYKFTGKELDKETGFTYFGARYYDGKLSKWISSDPILEKYLPSPAINEKNIEKNGKLPGYGGIFNTSNLELYLYANGNPLIYLDPDGNHIEHSQKFSDLIKSERGANGINYLQGRIVINPDTLIPRTKWDGTIVTSIINLGYNTAPGNINHEVSFSMLGRDDSGQLYRYDVTGTSSGTNDNSNPKRIISYTKTRIGDDGTPVGQTESGVGVFLGNGQSGADGTIDAQTGLSWFNPNIITGYSPSEHGVSSSEHPSFVQSWDWEKTPLHNGVLDQKASDLNRDVSNWKSTQGK